MKHRPLFDRVITLSMDPEIDVILWTDRLVPGGDNLVTGERHVAGGKALNLSRVLHNYGVRPLCITLAGSENRGRFKEGLQETGINCRLVEVEGTTRENLYVVQSDQTVTSLLRQGFSVPHEALGELEKVLLEEIEPNTLVVVSGQMPRGIFPRQLCRLCDGIREKGGVIALDTPAITQEDLLAIRPWMVKPDRDELWAYAGKELGTQEEMISYGRFLNGEGIEHCLISLSQEGLLYVGGGKVIQVDVPEVDVISEWGAGESCLAGFIVGTMQRLPIEKCVSTAAAMGTAACLVNGAQPPKRITTANILQQLQSKELLYTS